MQFSDESANKSSEEKENKYLRNRPVDVNKSSLISNMTREYQEKFGTTSFNFISYKKRILHMYEKKDNDIGKNSRYFKKIFKDRYQSRDSSSEESSSEENRPGSTERSCNCLEENCHYCKSLRKRKHYMCLCEGCPKKNPVVRHARRRQADSSNDEEA